MPQMEPDFARINLFPQSVLEAWHILGWIFEKIPLESYIKLRFVIIHGINPRILMRIGQKRESGTKIKQFLWWIYIIRFDGVNIILLPPHA